MANPELKIQTRGHRQFLKVRRSGNSALVNKNVAIAGLVTLVLVGLSLDWQLMLATSTAIGAMSTVYGAQNWNWRRNGVRFKQFIHGSNSKLAIAVAVGGGSMLLVYTMLSIWQSQTNNWLGFGESVQFLAILGILALLVRQLLHSNAQTNKTHLDRLVLDLASDNDLQRLIAVRQLSSMETSFSLEQEEAIAEYCQVLLQTENFVPVREAAFELLAALQPSPTSRKILSN
jgi:hypothetical protein